MISTIYVNVFYVHVMVEIKFLFVIDLGKLSMYAQELKSILIAYYNSHTQAHSDSIHITI